MDNFNDMFMVFLLLFGALAPEGGLSVNQCVYVCVSVWRDLLRRLAERRAGKALGQWHRQPFVRQGACRGWSKLTRAALDSVSENSWQLPHKATKTRNLIQTDSLWKYTSLHSWWPQQQTFIQISYFKSHNLHLFA